ncbi:hypothetical protein [uncultured Bacteroides sp.]|uniref:hypothetical protein n=1 Tax=uncultured Bacteroides sp. TaxID=162156 RepID=UPI0025FC8763|nr:hypothetical protein [uncultured Bacteroides sp.]
MGEIRSGANKVGKIYLGGKLIAGGGTSAAMKEYVVCSIDYYFSGNSHLGIIDDTNTLVAIYNCKDLFSSDGVLLFYDRLSNILYAIDAGNQIINVSFNKVIYESDGEPKNIICWHDKLIIGEFNDNTGRGYIKKIDSVPDSNEYLIGDDQGSLDETKGFIFNGKAVINNYSMGFFAYDKNTDTKTEIIGNWHVTITDPVFIGEDCYLYADEEETVIKIDKNFNKTEYYSREFSYLSDATHLAYIKGRFIVYADERYVASSDLANWEKGVIAGSNIPSSATISATIRYRNVNDKVFAYYVQDGIVYTAFSSDGVTFAFEDKTYELPGNLGTTKMDYESWGEDCVAVVNDNFLMTI